MPRLQDVTSVLNKTKRRDPWFLDEYTFNPYSSCSFNCLYCYIRGSKYGSNLEESLTVKTNAIELLDKQLGNRAKKKQYGFIVISSATDPYLQIEKNYEITRQALEIVLKYRFPVHMITKSSLITRDFDLLQAIDQAAILPDDLQPLGRGALITFSFSSLRDPVGKIFEPGATPPSERLKTLQSALEHGFHSGVSFMPLLPFISDTTEELDYAFSTFQQLGARYVMPSSITLYGDERADSKPLMLRAIEKHYPELLPRYQRYFSNSSELPRYYRNAFQQKMNELSKTFELPQRIF